MKKKIGFGALVLIVILQFFRIDKTNPEIIAGNDFIETVIPPDNIVTVLKTACYDCHSNESKYPWYSNIAPVSWWLKDHINEGREELNFSNWDTYSQERKIHKLEEMIEMIEEDEMPLREYTWLHSEAKLTSEQRKILLNWIKELKVYEDGEDEFLEEAALESIQLNNGQKWKANIETIKAIDNMIAILATEYDEERIINYASDGQKLNIELDQLIENCTMTGEAYDQLDRFLLPLKMDVETLIECDSLEECGIQLFDLLRYLGTFKEFFVLENEY